MLVDDVGDTHHIDAIDVKIEGPFLNNNFVVIFLVGFGSFGSAWFLGFVVFFGLVFLVSWRCWLCCVCWLCWLCWLCWPCWFGWCGWLWWQQSMQRHYKQHATASLTTKPAWGATCLNTANNMQKTEKRGKHQQQQNQPQKLDILQQRQQKPTNERQQSTMVLHLDPPNASGKEGAAPSPALLLLSFSRPSCCRSTRG